jgi:uncharacterized protein YdaU (DUF1376 family)
MAKKPYMPLMMGDWLQGTRGMKAEVKGVYLGLLIYQYDNGFLPSDYEELCLIEPELPKVWDKIKHKFKEVDQGKLQNDKCEEVRDFFNKKQANGSKGGRPKKPKQEPNTKPKQEPNIKASDEYEYEYEPDNDSVDDAFEESENLLTDQEKLAGLRFHDDSQWEKLWNDTSWRNKALQLHDLTETALRILYDKFRLERQSATTAVDRSPPTEVLKHFTHWIPKRADKSQPRVNGFKTPQVPSFDKNE